MTGDNTKASPLSWSVREQISLTSYSNADLASSSVCQFDWIGIFTNVHV